MAGLPVVIYEIGRSHGPLLVRLPSEGFDFPGQGSRLTR